MRRTSLVRPGGGPPARSARWRRTIVLASTAVLALSVTALPAQGQPEPEPAEPSPSASSAPADKASNAADDASPAARQALAAAKANAADGAKVLVFHGAAAEQVDPVAAAVAAVQELGAASGIGVDVSSDPASFSASTLAGYRGVVFLSAIGTELTPSQEDALEAFVEDGGGFLGIGDASRAQERSEWFTGLIGSRPVGALPDSLDVASVSATANNPPNEDAPKLVDGNVNTKWLGFVRTAQITVRLTEAAAVNQYALSSANDSAGRDPQDWTLQGSNDGTTWTDIDRRTNEDFPERFQTKAYTIANTTAYEYLRLDITRNSGDSITQLAELQFFAGDIVEPPPVPALEATVSIVDRQHPANDGLPLELTLTDRWTNWAPNPVGTVHTVAQVQENTYEPGEGANGAFHPISWCRDYDGGRSFYTSMGGAEQSWSNAEVRSHITGALQWTTGLVRGDCQATIGANYEIERLTAQNQPGQLDQNGEPHGLDVAADGTVFYIGKAACATGPIASWDDPNVGRGCGTIHQWDPESGDVTQLASLDVFGNRGSGSELVKAEDGLVGIALDPAFMDNGWIYTYWMPYDSLDRERRVGDRTISRFTYDHETQELDLDSRTDLLSWETQIHSCCHAGGGMDFDSDGNLYVGVGDSNSSGGSSGYSGNNWTQEFGGYSFQDARRTSGNTNDLNGKILRIHPEADGTYTIPDGNLFTGEEEGGGKTRPEIYVMGVRNISTLYVDPVTDYLHAAWVGPDAGGPNADLGPAKYETATIITSAGNQGWPYCMGNRQPYRDRSNTDASVLTDWYDCKGNLMNTSPRNTGLVDIPDARDNMIWYSPQGGNPDFPDRGDGVPTYDNDDATYGFPYMRSGGCQAVMTGPTFRESLVDTDSGVSWPSYWEGKWILGDNCGSSSRIAVTVDPEGIEEQAPPLFAENLVPIIPHGAGSNQLNSWMMTSRFGPDGALYMSDYSGGFFSLTPNQKLLRVVYNGGPATPVATASATAVQNKPLTIAFTGARSGGVSYAWDFGDGATSDEANPRHTYGAVGSYTATLTVTYADGETMTTEVDVTVGCAVPDDRSTVFLRDTDTGVANDVVGEGCTINDLIDDESSWPNHGQFVRHVTDTANGLASDGVITAREKATLTRLAAQSEIGTPGDTGWDAIFDGTAESLEGWTQAPGGFFELQDDGTILSRGGLGMLWYSAQEFADYSIRLQFRDVSPGTTRANSGVFIRFPNPNQPLAERPECGRVGSAANSPAWVAIYCGHEIQLYDGETGEPQKTGSVYNFDPIGLPGSGATPKGVWNDYEIRVEGQHYTIIRNGVVINEFDNVPGIESSRAGDPPTDLRQFLSGYIGLQNHGNNDQMEFRNVRVREL
ncbi:ThuA domain-containing protein [Jiangella alba]|uniref:PKD domain-containing protein n=1 Tax=Jiangella alba TaxID=561176 RepID=A0A1H5JPG2_9ACTN|nr:ThuA domain-containing protein [Jiangella alba]SEE54330.1 PKD domain-containing protein [Jiangella alba]